MKRNAWLFGSIGVIVPVLFFFGWLLGIDGLYAWPTWLIYIWPSSILFVGYCDASLGLSSLGVFIVSLAINAVMWILAGMLLSLIIVWTRQFFKPRANKLR
jgi:hypothetical protein